MDYFTIDSSTFLRDGIIENFNSMIYVERFNAWGEFKLITPSTPANRALLTPGKWIVRDGSYYPMRIETVDDKEDDADTARLLTVTGRSMEALLDDRVAMPAFAGLATTPTWDLTDTPGNVIRAVFEGICVTGDLSVHDTIPFLHSGTILDPGNIPEPASSFAFSFNPDTVYNTIKKGVCDVFDMGFRLIRDGDTGNVYFEVYMGNDLTSDQTLLPAVIFSEDFANLYGVEWLKSIATEKTVAYVFSQNSYAVVLAPGASSSDEGFDKRVLLVDASDVTLTAGAPLTATLNNRGLQALAQNKAVYMFDGQIPQFASYTYGVDYNLGDVVEERDSDGTATFVRVLEQIFVTNDQGDVNYPSFSITSI